MYNKQPIRLEDICSRWNYDLLFGIKNMYERERERKRKRKNRENEIDKKKKWEERR